MQTMKFLQSHECPFEHCQGEIVFQPEGFWRCRDCGSEIWPASKIAKTAVLAEDFKEYSGEQLKNRNCLMEYCKGWVILDRRGYFRCLECGAEYWYQPLGEPKAMQKIYYLGTGQEINRGMVGTVAPGGGGSSGKNSRKLLLKKRTTTLLYKLLCKPSFSDNEHLNRLKK